MSQSLDTDRLEANLGALREEVAELREQLDAVASLQREAAQQEALDALAPVARALVRLEAAAEEEPTGELGHEVAEALGRLGLARIGSVGDVVELWPEQARGQLELDRDVPLDAAMVRVEVLASGWARDELVLARPLGRVIEVVP